MVVVVVVFFVHVPVFPHSRCKIFNSHVSLIQWRQSSLVYRYADQYPQVPKLWWHRKPCTTPSCTTPPFVPSARGFFMHIEPGPVFHAALLEAMDPPKSDDADDDMVEPPVD